MRRVTQLFVVCACLSAVVSCKQPATVTAISAGRLLDTEAGRIQTRLDRGKQGIRLAM